MLWKFSQQVRAVVTCTKCSLLPNQERKWNTTRAGVRTRACATLLNVSTFKSSKLNTPAGEALPFQLYYTVNESLSSSSKYLSFWILSDITLSFVSFVRPQNVWRRTCTSQFSLSTDPRHLSKGEDPCLSDKMLHPGTFTKEICKWCQKYSMQAPDSLHKWGYYYYTTVIYFQPNRNIPRRGVGVLLVFFLTQKASHCVSNDLICMHCPLQICVTVGLPHPPK